MLDRPALRAPEITTRPSRSAESNVRTMTAHNMVTITTREAAVVTVSVESVCL